MVAYYAQNFNAWHLILPGYGGSESVPAPGDYDNDGKTDIAYKNNTTGEWKIDYSGNGFGSILGDRFRRTQVRCTHPIRVNVLPGNSSIKGLGPNLGQYKDGHVRSLPHSTSSPTHQHVHSRGRASYVCLHTSANPIPTPGPVMHISSV